MKLLFAAAAAASLLAAFPASAQMMGGGTTQLYGTIGYTQASTDVDFEEIGQNVELSSGLITGRFGGRFSQYFGAEAEASFGVTESEETINTTFGGVPVRADINYKMTAEAAAYGVGFLPLSPNADLIARIGFGRIDSDIEVVASAGGFSATEEQSGSSNFIGYGVGGQFFFDGLNGVRVDYTRFDLTEDDGDESAEFDTFSIAFVRKF